MQDEILSPVLPSDSNAVPRYNIIGQDGDTLFPNVQLQLQNKIIQEGTPFDTEHILPSSVCTLLGLPASATPAEAYQKLQEIKLAIDSKASTGEAQAGSDDTKYMTALKTAQAIIAKIASQQEAQTGADNTKIMTPLRVSQQITSKIATQGEAQAGTSDSKLMTPLKVKQAIGSAADTVLDQTTGQRISVKSRLGKVGISSSTARIQYASTVPWGNPDVWFFAGGKLWYGSSYEQSNNNYAYVSWATKGSDGRYLFTGRKNISSVYRERNYINVIPMVGQSAALGCVVNTTANAYILRFSNVAVSAAVVGDMCFLLPNGCNGYLKSNQLYWAASMGTAFTSISHTGSIVLGAYQNVLYTGTVASDGSYVSVNKIDFSSGSPVVANSILTLSMGTKGWSNVRLNSWQVLTYDLTNNNVYLIIYFRSSATNNIAICPMLLRINLATLDNNWASLTQPDLSQNNDLPLMYWFSTATDLYSLTNDSFGLPTLVKCNLNNPTMVITQRYGEAVAIQVPNNNTGLSVRFNQSLHGYYPTQSGMSLCNPDTFDIIRVSAGMSVGSTDGAVFLKIPDSMMYWLDTQYNTLDILGGSYNLDVNSSGDTTTQDFVFPGTVGSRYDLYTDN